ncbi:BON domain-containing protein [Paraburkholderia sp. RAU2J]|uniref:BON domain-containing protein n=1 Tax=Paraburkholderia sp. RAU2J TaxID=1938810 RepID=UPI000EB34F25|nr:BON domain-containing protein [Paraburkholderia sp. RAU2J]RKT13764.1 BON domain-containing protein [Paraburkholderia sp. RAU2J]
MYAIHAIKLAGAALLVAVSFQANAQTSDAAPPADTGAQSAKSQHKADRAANRSLGRKVRNALSKAMGVSASHITVRSAGGAITLQGTVPEATDSQKAEEIAKGVAGVESVKNALSIRPAGT